VPGNTTRLTDERLKSWLNGKQPERERMCMALLGTIPGWTDIRPRRPEGGPDGGRDIEATFQSVYSAFGAVGFQNGVSDSPEDKRVAKQKFRGDVTAAKGSRPEVSHFAFFTNVDLTPGEVEECVAIGRQHGFVLVEVFHRERIRMLLDVPSGFAFRFQYLDVEMSREEQASFFQKFHDQLEAMIARGFDFTMGQLNRVEFFQRLRRGIQQIELVVQLKMPTSVVDLVPFRVWLEITSRKLGTHSFGPDFVETRDTGRSLVLYGQDVPASITIVQGKNEMIERSFGVSSSLFAENPKEGLGTTVRHGTPVSHIISFVGQVSERGPYSTIESLDRTSLLIYMTRSLAERAKHIFVRVDDWLLHSIPIEALHAYDGWPDYYLPDTDESDRSVPWVYLSPIQLAVPVLGLAGSHPVPIGIDFGTYTPRRLGPQPIPTVAGTPPRDGVH
jgi:hypothetical protein